MNQAQIAQGGQHQPPQGQNQQQHRRYQQDDQQGGGDQQNGDESEGEAQGEAQTVPPVRGEGLVEDGERLAEAIEAELAAEADAASRAAR